MNNVDLMPLIDNDTEFEKIKSSIEERFKGNWDDAVHESYGLYVNQVKERAVMLHKIRSTAEDIKRTVEGLNVETLVREAELICSEADSV